MKQQDNNTALVALGLTDYAAGPSSPIPTDEPIGFRGAEGLNLERLLAMPAEDLLHAVDRQLSAGDLSVELHQAHDAPQLVVISADSPLEVIGADALKPDVCQERDDDVYVDTRRLTAPLAVRAEGDGLVLRPGPGSVPSWFPFSPRLALDPLLSPTPPLANWLETDDPWLLDWTQALCVSSAPAAALEAVGAICRHGEPPSGDALHDALRLADGSARLASAYRWLAAQTPALLAEAESVALGACDAVEETLEWLLTAVDPQSASWRTDMTHLCEDRDDLESLRYALHEAGADPALALRLATLDAAAAAWFEALPPFETDPSERLRRARLASPTSWWVAATR